MVTPETQVPSERASATVSSGLARTYLLSEHWPFSVMSVFLITDICLELAGPLIVSYFIELVQLGTTYQPLAWVAVLFLFVATAQQIASAQATYWSERVGWTATNALRVDLLRQVLRQDPIFYESHSVGELIERIDGDAGEINEFFSSLVVQIIGNSLLLLGVLITLTLVSWVVGLSFAALTAVGMIVLARVPRYSTPHWQAARQEGALFYGEVTEVLHAREDLRALGAVEYGTGRVVRRIRTWLPVTLRATAWGTLVWGVTMVVLTATTVLSFGLSGHLYMIHALSLSRVYLIVAYAAILLTPMDAIRVQLQKVQQAGAAVRRVREILHMRSGLADGTLELPRGPLSVEFCGVSFRYPNAKPADTHLAPDERTNYVIHEVSFKISPGRVVALVGKTGAGKTTLADLIMRMYDPQHGAIHLGGMDIRTVRLDSLRSRIAFVTQDVHIFDATLRDNLTFFDETMTDDQLREVLHSLDLDAWYEGLDCGLDSVISSASVSAGEAQLIALARVFVKDPGLVILDEPTSRLDPASEGLIEHALRRLLRGRTGLLIAHQCATVGLADEVLLLSDGRISPQGSAVGFAGNHS
jgi:ATP-binding cassette, subfamily B, bacterial